MVYIIQNYMFTHDAFSPKVKIHLRKEKPCFTQGFSLTRYPEEVLGLDVGGVQQCWEVSPNPGSSPHSSNLDFNIFNNCFIFYNSL